MTWSLIILEGGGVEGERKQKDREGAGKERRARITMASMRRANREMREYQGGQIIRERPSYFASSHSHPCQHFMRHGIIHSPLLLSQIHPRGLFRSHRHPSNRFQGFTRDFSHDFRMINRCCCAAWYSIAWKLIVAFHCVLLKDGRRMGRNLNFFIIFHICWKNSWRCTLIIGIKWKIYTFNM